MLDTEHVFNVESRRKYTYTVYTFLVLIFLFYNLIWKVIAENLSDEEIKGLKQMFNNMDTDRSGTITYEELKSGLTKLGSKLSESEIRQLMDAVSLFSCTF